MIALLLLLCAILAGCSEPTKSEQSELLLINEVMIKNSSQSGAMSPEGKYDDYVELFNAGSDTVWLNHYFLTDCAELPSQCNLPVRQLAPGEFAVFYGGSSKEYEQEYLGFSFSSDRNSGEIVQLLNSEMIVVDSCNYLHDTISLKKGVSFGRLSNGSTSWTIQKNATPGRSNE